MKPIEELLSELKRLDIKIWAEGDYLRYDAPKGKLSSVVRSQLVERKQEILAFLRQVNLKITSIQPISRNQEIPLSFAQQRLWFLNQWEGENASYNESVAVRLKGLLNLSALQHSLNEIVRRHEALRTTFVCIDGKPIQTISPDLHLSLSLIDLREIPQCHQRQAEALKLLAQATNCPFQLTEAPLLRTTLIKLDETEHILSFTIHHIICDNWSMGILLQEVAVLYTAFCSNKPLPLLELPIQYADFAIWQRQWLTGDRLQSQLNYWQQQLINYPPILQLPTDRPRPALQSFCGKTQSFSLSSDLTEALKALSRQEEMTLFMTLLTAFVTLLYRYSQQDDILIGTAIANRNYKELERLIGLFANTLVLRTNCAGNPTFQELLHQVRECTLSAYTHQDLPFEYLVEQLQPERNPSYNPLFQVMFVLQNSPMEELKLPGLDLNLLPLENQTAKFDLSLVMQEKECGLYGELEYNTDLFNANTICRMVEHLQILLTGIVVNPEQRLGDLPILTPAEQQQLLVSWNHTQADYPQDICIHQLFADQVEQTPNAVAVVFADRQLTYQELNQQADALAHYLKQLGVKPEVLVGICLEKSLEMVIGILAILKAGGAYLPLDPSYPKERLAFILEDAKPLVLLTQTRLITELSLHKVKVVCLDTSWQNNISETITQRYPTEVKSQNLAYIIYTSGSTGTPKGVIIAHQALVNHSLAVAKIYQLRSNDKVLQFASISFDVAAEELFPSWLCGSTVVIRPDWVLSFSNFQQFLESEKITVLNLPTAYWHQWVSELSNSNIALPPKLRLVIVGTEQAQREKLALWQQQVGTKVRWLNAYGPTEATIGATIYEPVDVPENFQIASVPIGRPIDNTQIYILDKHLNPTPIGIPGELYISGLGLARGYLNRPDLTAEKFIPNPFNNSKFKIQNSKFNRLYKTGDLARYLQNGNIEYLGRIDNQVKIRGYRIELEEIEIALTQHPNVQETVVITHLNDARDTQLIAYVVPNNKQQPTAKELRIFLKQQLPDYMIPSAFMLIENLPQMPNGKVDRQKLLALEFKQPSLEKDFVAPRDDLELQLTQIWEEVLGISPIGVTDNFFELGGHSLLAVRLMAKIEKLFGCRLSLFQLFQEATIEKLKTLLSQNIHSSQNPSPLVAIQPRGSKKPLFFVHPVGGNVFCYYELASSFGLDRPFYGLRSLGLDGECKPYTSIEDMASAYISAIRVIQPEGSYLLGGWSMGGVIAFEMATQLQKQGQKVDLLALLDSQAPISKTQSININYYERDRLLIDLAQDIARSTGDENLNLDHLNTLYTNLTKLKLEEKLDYFWQQGKIFKFLPQYLERQHFHHLWKVFQNNTQALIDYNPKKSVNSILLLRASKSVIHDNLNSNWQVFSTQALQIINILGNHYTMLRKPSVYQLQKAINKYLENIEK
ncbi:non-ribosomal peptide synthetase [Nostoc sp. 2RC]|uniref:non-ribosomal peptide synthetase n=1 Tax=Nostoc sp. 2RC TaxID=2485484 RepID=UPI00162911DC|nr:non-ribosomal peptide synthetase [Nostoc sp. 2RC]MBC1236261.1 amino acid adenylation domain-containing protein [Nostoc sp. 2RC]